MKYRQLSEDELKQFSERQVNSGKYARTSRIVKQLYGTNAYKVIVKANCEYNDEYYTPNGVVVVLDKYCNELDGKNGTNPSDGIMQELYGRMEYLDDNLPDHSFLVDETPVVPKLYVEVNE